MVHKVLQVTLVHSELLVILEVKELQEHKEQQVLKELMVQLEVKELRV